MKAESLMRGGKRPLVSVLIACRNEERFIGPCLEGVLASDYPRGRMEVLVVDGRSEDRTRSVVRSYAARDRRVRLLDNPQRITSCAMNIGVRAARGSVIAWLSAHADYPRDYLSRSVAGLVRHEADNVGGNMVTRPRRPTLLGRGIAAVLSHPFGVGNARFRTMTRRPTWVDTVFGGCYRRDVFDRIGWFNERLTFSQDMEFNLRLRKAGGRTLLLPSITATYYARSDLASFLRHNIRNGRWVILPMLYSTIMPVTVRHLVPMAFVLGLAGLGAAARLAPVGSWALSGAVAAYGACALGAAVQIAWRTRDVAMILVLPPLFLVLHVSYGIGSLFGIAQAAGILARRLALRVEV